ncbi:MAG: gamma-glutamyl-phosphate reductase, partial [Rhizobium sp.]|nr:gamma-glutamyl-phosphate reductase [Rhizobium sp.]
MSPEDADAMIADLGNQARTASRVLALAPTAQKAEALHNAARLVRERQADILAANADDLRHADRIGITAPMRDRLELEACRLEQIASSLHAIAELQDP